MAFLAAYSSQPSAWEMGMPVNTVSTDLVRVALERAEGTPFERFVNDFFPAIAGGSYVPLGGNKDGGADGYEGTIYERVERAGSYYQASVEADPEAKIKRTIARLTEFGREPKRLTYVTNQTVRYVDTVEAALSEELDVTVVIRDAGYVISHTNDGPQTIQAFNDHLRHYTDFLKGVGNSNLVAPSAHIKSPAVYVFLAQELDRADGTDENDMLDAVTDALILWALEGTDPDKGILKSLDEVWAIIKDELPSMTSIVQPRLSPRLRELSSKRPDQGRAVNWHRGDDKYCLPYATRLAIETENAEDETLRSDVRQVFHKRADSIPHPGIGEQGLEAAVAVAFRALQITFEREGLEFSSFLEKPDQESEGFPTIADSIRAALIDENVSGKRAGPIGALAFEILRGTFYRSEECEREYLHRLSKTYALLFTLRSDPRLITFFAEMTERFYLYVGADILVTALSEQCLAKEDQVTRNTLLMASRLGARLILTGPALEEVISHLRACDLEFENHIGPHEAAITYEHARQAPHILLRAYLYTRTVPAPRAAYTPPNWPAFINLFCSYRDLHENSAEEDLKRYLLATFGMAFRSREDLLAITESSEVESLTKALKPAKRANARLAENDALLALSVYGHRNRRREDQSGSEFGYNTWWLTSETQILRHTSDLASRHGTTYIMRPNFLLKFMTLSPSASEARSAFRNLFPSLLGIHLARRMDSGAFHKLMRRVDTAEGMEPARRAAAIARISDELKGAHEKYLVSGEEPRRKRPQRKGP
jgi:hypothetical protein